MTILDVLEQYPETEEKFRALDRVTGDCVLCRHLFDDFENFLEHYHIDRDYFSADIFSTTAP